MMADSINHYLYTISNTAIRAHQIDNFSEKLAEVNYP
jgi:hypothetical protein